MGSQFLPCSLLVAKIYEYSTVVTVECTVLCENCDAVVFAKNYKIHVIETGLADLFENLSVNSLKRDLSKNATFKPTSFLICLYL